MNKIYLLGDIHTVSAFRLAGVTGIVAGKTAAPSRFKDVVRQGDAGIIIITSELAEGMQEEIARLSLSGTGPVVIEIPGIDDERGFRASAVQYIAEALGIAL